MNDSSTIDLHRARVRQAVYAAISDCLALDASTLRDDVRVKEDLGADSMDVVSILLMLDSSLGVDIDPLDIPGENVRIGWIVDVLAQRCAG
jgi:acyl carrier protein